MRSKKELRDSCESLIRYLYKETLKKNRHIKNIFIVSNEVGLNNESLNIDSGFRYAGEDKLQPPIGCMYYCTLAEYIMAEGDFISIAKEKK